MACFASSAAATCSGRCDVRRSSTPTDRPLSNDLMRSDMLNLPAWVEDDICFVPRPPVHTHGSFYSSIAQLGQYGFYSLYLLQHPTFGPWLDRLVGALWIIVPFSVLALARTRCRHYYGSIKGGYGRVISSNVCIIYVMLEDNGSVSITLELNNTEAMTLSQLTLL